MAALSVTDQQVWRKATAAKSQSMTEVQLATSLPQLRPRDLQASLATLLRLQLMTVTTLPSGDKLYNAQKSQARQESSVILTSEQKIVKKVIEESLDRGIAMPRIRKQIPQDLIAQTVLRKIVLELEKSGHIKSFKAVSAPTTTLYHSARYKPAADLTGGVWYDDNKEFDEGLVQVVRTVLLEHVRKKTFKGYGDKHNKNGEPSTVNNPIYPAGRTPSLPTPQQLLAFVKKTNVVQALIGIKEVMEVMRALELDGLVEIIKPVGGVQLEDDGDDDDMEPLRKRAKAENGDAGDGDEDMEDDEKARKRELAKEKEKEKLKAKKKREKEKEREREKAREKEKKKREKEKEKERKRKKKEKEREKKKKKKKGGSDSDSSAADSLQALSDVERSESRKKKTKTKKRAASTDSSSSSSSSDSSDSDSDSASSVDTSDIDNPASSSRRSRPRLADGEANLTPAGLQDLSDVYIVYRATNRLTVPLGQTEVPCGKCPVFDFCAEGGPVNAEGCEYWGNWLEGGKGGGWEGEDKVQEKQENGEDEGMEDEPLVEH